MADLQSELFWYDAAGAEMSGIQTISVSNAEVNKLLAIEEGHFVDLKAIDTSPAKGELKYTGRAVLNGKEIGQPSDSVKLTVG